MTRKQKEAAIYKMERAIKALERKIENLKEGELCKNWLGDGVVCTEPWGHSGLCNKSRSDGSYGFGRQ